MDLASPPSPGAFFASRRGVCVYVTVGAQNVRVCFASADAEGRVESETADRTAATAVALATGVFLAHLDTRAPLFETIEGSSQVDN